MKKQKTKTSQFQTCKQPWQWTVILMWGKAR